MRSVCSLTQRAYLLGVCVCVVFLLPVRCWVIKNTLARNACFLTIQLHTYTHTHTHTHTRAHADVHALAHARTRFRYAENLQADLQQLQGELQRTEEQARASQRRQRRQTMAAVRMSMMKDRVIGALQRNGSSASAGAAIAGGGAGSGKWAALAKRLSGTGTGAGAGGGGVGVGVGGGLGNGNGGGGGGVGGGGLDGVSGTPTSQQDGVRVKQLKMSAADLWELFQVCVRARVCVSSRSRQPRCGQSSVVASAQTQWRAQWHACPVRLNGLTPTKPKPNRLRFTNTFTRQVKVAVFGMFPALVQLRARSQRAGKMLALGLITRELKL